MRHAQASSYRDCLNAVLRDPRSCVEYPGGFRVRVGEHSHSANLEDENSDEERAAGTPPTEDLDCGDFVAVVRPSAGTS